MKLQHKIAGTILLPLAAAAMTTSVQAADVDVYGRIQAHLNVTTPDGGDADFTASANESRFGLKADNGKGAKGHFEFDMNASSVRLRHAYVNFNNVTVGQTWKPSAALELLFPTLDPTTNALTSAPALRVGQISTKLDLGAGSLNVGLYDDSTVSSAMPGVAAKFVADMDALKLIAAFDMKQANEEDTTETATSLTAGVVANLSGMTVKGIFTSYDNATMAVLSGADGAEESFIGASVTVPMGGAMSLNAAFETATEAETDAYWVNVKTKLESGVDVGAEFRSSHAEATTVAAMVNYNF